MSGFTSVPPELWALVMDELNYRQLVTASRVCQQWRAVAFDHPSFWRDIHIALCGPDAPAVYWLARRLSAGQHRPFVLTIDIDDKDIAPVPDEVYSLLRTSISTVERLSINIAATSFERLWGALEVPAPLLSDFSLLARAAPLQPRSPIPPTIFDGNTPVLRTVRLPAVIEPTIGPSIPAFARVEHVQIADNQKLTASFVVGFFTLFPGAKHFDIHCQRAGLWPVSYDESTLAAIRDRVLALQSLELCFQFDRRYDLQEFCKHFPVAHIRRLLLRRPTPEDVDMALSHLEGPPYDVIIRHVDTGSEYFSSRPFTISFASAASRGTSYRQQRIFLDSDSGYLGRGAHGSGWRERVNLVFHDMSIWEQVRSLTITTSIWPMLAMWQPIPLHVSELCVVFSLPSQLVKLSEFGYATGEALQVLSLRNYGTGISDVDVADVLVFAERSSSHHRLRLRVHSSIELSGDTGPLSQYFDLETYDGDSSSWTSFDEAGTE
ncbi:hypothetical protein EXIGLDRAFT_754740 [Exidia glandulosa HHB12029]|uniref:F-box domain-containing protein n=1 Tax=Exidia glandulosa HHB12029 TaxID=1314781 RepID=A0A165CNB7_EXIGL|nr:hypothetical protein EXIGLDRAFT_754740 [Exidia glandulosa HHB12029]